MNNLQLNDEILDYLLAELEKNPELKFGVRVQNNKGRLEQGQWFQGDGRYSYISFYKRGDSKNKTKTIGYVFMVKPDGSVDNWIELVYPDETDPNIIAFYKSVKQLIAEKCELVITQSELDSYRNVFKLGGTYLENFGFFQKEITPEIDKLIVEFGLENLFFYSQEEFNKNLDKILKFRSMKNDEVSIKATKSEISQLSLNQILYGPPGTGKTYEIQQIIKERQLGEESASDTFTLDEFVSTYTWWQLIGLVLYNKGPLTVPQLSKDPIILAKLGQSELSHLNVRLWSSLQHHTVDDCPNVNLARRIGVRIFYKEENSVWRLDAGKRFADEFALMIEDFSRVSQAKTAKKKRFSFLTCHQSLSYEDFIEGIKPVIEKAGIEEESEGANLQYEIRKGLFYKACEKAAQLAGYVNLLECLKDSVEGRKAKFSHALSNNQIFVIFLDEINRCNVSAVFGELITLIESDKRLGAENEIADVELPYSQSRFGVPANLHIIGTMNTADRSVEALDTALRRRFSFEEMMPKYEKVDNIEFVGFNLGQVLKIINGRIEALLDRDHAIGHSYFINIKPGDTKALKNAFQNCIIPLLQEYFYHDYEKIAMVLGSGFVDVVEAKNNKVTFAVQSPNQPEKSKTFQVRTEIEYIEEAVKELLHPSWNRAETT
ncbi:AAA family ATPase [Flavobacterium sp.]|uniref:McrB family protein n=1 Tax=Flavobacterium sp. TaxID=239 RepID=UPI001214E4D1|nr:AAA family ATPase [Flavobacterium sp.]RZJ69219.1 MAG: hypothetical protein EOO49_18145 [Flavobacterium sp.]